ncbi:hypothetical protein EDC01DRAFT_58751 [Geopyxis carbonaria]|nr:hypothetical protein EDC01DRAFT_58751 [Geopyxis carbonaria]
MENMYRHMESRWGLSLQMVQISCKVLSYVSHTYNHAEQQSCELSLNTAKIYTGRTALLHVNDETDDSSLQSSDQPEKLKIVLPNHIASANEIKTIVAATQQLPSPQLSEDESPRESSPPPPGSGLFQKPKPIGVSRYLFQESGKPFYPKAETPKQRSEILKASVLSRDRFDNDRIRRQPRAKYPSHFAYKQSPSTPSRKRPRTFATPISTMGASNSTPQWYNAINQPSNRRAAVSSVTKPQSKRGPILQVRL